jgi:hypothetical protein
LQVAKQGRANARQDAIAGEREADRAPVPRERAERRDAEDAHRCGEEQIVRRARKPVGPERVVRGSVPENAVDHQPERPGLDQTEQGLREERRKRRGEQPALARDFRREPREQSTPRSRRSRARHPTWP